MGTTTYDAVGHNAIAPHSLNRRQCSVSQSIAVEEEMLLNFFYFSVLWNTASTNENMRHQGLFSCIGQHLV